MAVLNVKGFPDDLYEKLKERAESEHRSLAQEVVHLLSKAVASRARPSLMDLRGLGKEIWQGIDAARYIEEERASWD